MNLTTLPALKEIWVYITDNTLNENEEKSLKLNDSLDSKLCDKFHQHIHEFQFKAEEVRINVMTIEETYTSKCRFLDNESFHNFQRYLGKKISRSFFHSTNDTFMHADVNYSYNIILKTLLKAFTTEIDDMGFHPF